MPKGYVLIILAFTLITYANSLSNGFVGDDEIIIVDNFFYRSWANLPALFQKDYLTDTTTGYFYHETLNSGSVAYRPALSFTYFLDYGIWKLNPFGYHLHNLLYHLGNSLLVFFLMSSIGLRKQTALICSLFFVSHPILSEAVCNIGFRGDLLSSFFFLLAFLSFIRYTQASSQKKAFYYIGSVGAFFLAVFSKESTIIFLPMVILYEKVCKKITISEMVRGLGSRYLGFLLVTIFYLYIYLVVFPNTTFKNITWLGGTPLTHILTIVKILSHYLLTLWFPLGIGILPFLYAPSVEPIDSLQNLFSFLLVVVYFAVMYKVARRFQGAAFFIFWFLIGFLPVSNIVPLANPMAYRFMYLPSVGFLALLALIIDHASLKEGILKKYPNIKSNLIRFILGFYILTTVSLNGLWKSNYAVASEIIRRYPQVPGGYVILGVEYLRAGQYEKAQNTMGYALKLGSMDPRIYYILGVCYRTFPEKAEKYLTEAIRLQPSYFAPYDVLGRIYLSQKDYVKASLYLEKSIVLEPHWPVHYAALMQAYGGLHRMKEAQALLEMARRDLPDFNSVKRLERMYSELETKSLKETQEAQDENPP